MGALPPAERPVVAWVDPDWSPQCTGVAGCQVHLDADGLHDLDGEPLRVR